MDADYIIVDKAAYLTKWQYGVHHIKSGSDSVELLEDLNSLGSFGWEICGSLSGLIDVVAIILLKRELPKGVEVELEPPPEQEES